MGKKRNQYKHKAKKKSFLSGLGNMTTHLDTKQNVEHTLAETGKDILGLVVGGAVGSNINSLASFLSGVVLTGIGHYKKNRLIQVLGIGLIAAPVISKESPGVKGLEGLEGIKERLKAYRDVWVQKLRLNKMLQKKVAATAGFGDMQFFDYSDPMSGHLSAPGDDLAALDDIENQLAESAMEFSGSMGDGPDNLLGEGQENLLGDGQDSLLGDAQDRLY